ncbi:MAG: carbon-nitrogen family hydrolase [Desulfobacterales bacterium]|nr:carbon-nitrogen family hydrolase [Desulfobacterales bacterium]
MITITSLQPQLDQSSKSKRIQSALSQLDQLPKSDLILLPEIWATGFFCFDQYEAESETTSGELVKAFQKKARERDCHIHMGSFVERDGNQYYNTSLLINPRGEIIARYRKIHLFGYQSMEQQILTPGDRVTTIKTDLGHVGLATCYDLRFPELFREMSSRGVDIILVTSAWPLARLSAWELFNRARAHENLAFLVSCNCAGADGGTPYAGNSMVVSPMGEILIRADQGPGHISTRISIEEATQLRREFPALADRVL